MGSGISMQQMWETSSPQSAACYLYSDVWMFGHSEVSILLLFVHNRRVGRHGYDKQC